MQDSGSWAVFKVTARDQDHYKGPSGTFATYCNISCFFVPSPYIRFLFSLCFLLREVKNEDLDVGESKVM